MLCQTRIALGVSNVREFVELKHSSLGNASKSLTGN